MDINKCGCGGTFQISNLDAPYNRGKNWQAVCDGCGCEYNTFRTKESLIETINTAHPDVSALQQRVEELERALELSIACWLNNDNPDEELDNMFIYDVSYWINKAREELQ